VFLVSDFGDGDEFAGVMRAVVTRDAPGVPVVDLTHQIPPFDVRAGALALERAVPHLGPGVVVAVVDPGVGTGRRAVAVAVDCASGPRFLVGPDNGIFTFVLEILGRPEAAVALPSARWRPEAGDTFDGRDVFAPAAARLWAGASLAEIGSPFAPEDLVTLPRPHLETTQGSVVTEVLWVDRFGNVQLSARPIDIAQAGLGAQLEVVAGGTTFTVRSATSFEIGGDIGLIPDSNARLSFVCRRRSAAAVLEVQAGDLVALRDPADPHNRREAVGRDNHDEAEPGVES
jgi:S-adenosyl-L-methionine hydrolase (adenosine-forming)